MHLHDDGVTRLDSIQAMRAIGALSVLTMHAFLVAGLHFMKPGISTALVVSLGTWGVDLFFVISGFVIGRLMFEDQQRATSNWSPRMAFDFWMRRMLRIFPIYWVCFLVAMVTALHPVPLSDRFNAEIVPMLLLVVRGNLWLPVAWTLAFEVYFYTLCAAIILFSALRMRTAFVAVAVVQIVVIILKFAPISGINLPLMTPSSPLVMDFLAGVLVAAICRKTLRLSGISLFIGVVLIAIGVALVNRRLNAGGSSGSYPWGFVEQFERMITFGTGSAFIIYGTVASDIKRLIRIPRGAVMLGDASYSIYLVHLPLLFYIILSSGTLGITLPPTPAVFIFYWILLPVAVSFAVYILVERPLVLLSRKLMDRTPRSIPQHAS
jgi:peptidoglycan/LPS O-acetylase OafA/YrhL